MEDDTDDASIKPVSSLRSHFENMTVSKPTPASPVPVSRNDRNQAKVSESNLGSPSVQLSARSAPDQAHQGLARGDSDTAAKKRPPPPSAQKPEIPPNRKTTPIDKVTTAMPPPRSPPKVNITSPRSPPKFIEIPKSSMAAPSHAIVPSASSSMKSEPPPLPPPRQRRIPSRSHTPVQEPPRSPFLDDAEMPEGGMFPPPPPLSEPSGSGRASPAGPPVNRAAKTKSRESSAFSTTRMPLESNAPTEKISPFNTPPHSNEGSPEEEQPPPIPHHSKPSMPLSNVPSIATFEPPPTHHTVAGKRREQELQSAANSFGASQQRSSSEFQRPRIEDDQPESRPILPPRRDLSPRNQAIDYAPRKSSDHQTRPSALSQGFSIPNGPTSRIAAPRAPVTDFSAMQLTPKEPKHTPRKSSSQIVTHSQSQPSRTLTFAQEPDPTKLEIASSPTTDFPDTTRTNRRPPFFADGARFISIGYDLRLMAVCGEHVCVTGLVTRVWNLLTGRLLLSVAHAEGVKVTAVAFKPARKIEEEGTRLWLGTNWGELQEVDIASKKVVNTNGTAHHRKEVLKIHRHGAELWTLDEEGKVFVWPAGNDGSPDMSSGVQNPKIPRGHTSSIVAKDLLWLATGKDIRVFRPNANPDAEAFHVTTQSYSQPSTGDITSSAIIPTDPDIVYFGHADGKISMYSCAKLKCVGVVNASVFKINSMVGVSNNLWVGYNTGWLYVYDTTTRPWRAKKDWFAHENPIISLVADRTSLWKLDRLQVVSLGADNILSIWDGMLQDDWLEEEMHSIASEFCTFRDMSALVVTWNAGASKPRDLSYDMQDAGNFKAILPSGDVPDIIVFGLQELVDLEDKKLTAKSFFKSKKQDSYGHEHLGSVYRAWRDHLTQCLDDTMPANEPYLLLHSSSLVGLFSCVFVRASIKNRVRNPEAAEVKTGMGGAYGNKGALIVRFLLDDTSTCFVNCHLAAGQSQTRDRNHDVAAILESSPLPAVRLPGSHGETFVCGGDGSMVLDHEICVLNGDLNYRIDTMSRDTVISALKADNVGKLLDRDQLLLSRRKNPAFRLRSFTEAPIKFWPTYKYDVGTDTYDTSEKRRAPAWCDRILHRGQGFVEQTEYKRHEVRVSDHRPVSARFIFTTKTVQPDRRGQCWKRCAQKFETIKRQVSNDAKLDYLTNIFGLSTQEAQELISHA